MKKIVLPADFSGPGQAGLSFAADLAQRTGAELIILDFANADQTEASDESPHDASQATQHPELTYWQSIHPDIAIRVEPTDLPLEAAITAACDRHQPDLVLLGVISHRVKEGSGSKDLARTTRRLAYPLLVIEKPVTLPLRRVLFVSDFSESEMAVFERVLSLVGRYDPEVHLLYVRNSQYFDMPLILAKSVMRDFEDRAMPLTTHLHVSQHKKVSDAVAAYIKEADIDLVALGNQPRSLFYRIFSEDVLSGIIRDTDTPVLIVPRFEAAEQEAEET
jgi:nucleotide-binding universal stress UspA family protein